MLNRTALVPNAYRAPRFIPNGFVDILGALSIVVGPFDDQWTEDEVRQRRDDAAHSIMQACYAGNVSAEIITASGGRHPMRQDKWGGTDTKQIFDQGTTSLSVGPMYLESTIKGHVLLPEAELRQALDAGEPIEVGAPETTADDPPIPGEPAQVPSPPWWPRTTIAQSRWRWCWDRAIEIDSTPAKWNVSSIATKLAKKELAVDTTTEAVEKRAATIRKLLGKMRKEDGPPAKEK